MIDPPAPSGGPRAVRAWSSRPARLLAVTVLLLLAGLPAIARSQTGGIQGFGASTRGGADGTVVRVTNLNDAGPGSLREALHRGDRTIVFDVAGEILLRTHLYVRGAFVTIDGLSAPSPGITLRGHGLIIRGNRGAHDVIVRGIRVRDSAIDGFQVAYGTFNVVIDHVSVAGSADGNLDITDSHGVTVSWSIIGNNKKNMLIKYNPSRITLHHNALVGSLERNPQIRIDDTENAVATEITADIRNNVVANWHTGYGTIVWYGPWVNVVNNVYASAKHRSALKVEAARLFTAGNLFTGDLDVNRLGSESTAFAAAPVDTQDACAAAKLVLASAGVRPLDIVDQQLLASIAMPGCPGAPGLVARPASLRFLVVERGAKLPEQTVHVSAEGADGLAWTATVSTGDGGAWLAATPASGNTPGQIVIEARPSGLAPGTYPATISIAAHGSTAPLSIPVELVVATPSGDAAPTRSP